MSEGKVIHVNRREIIKSSPEHTIKFKSEFELKPQYRDNPECKDAFDYAATHKLCPDEMNFVGMIIQRKTHTNLKQERLL